MSVRKSNIELLRILSMTMVLAVHLDGASLGLPEAMGDISGISAHDWWRIIVESFTIIGVNVFTLISGYFGIRASWQGFIKLVATCLFYSCGVYLGLVVTGMLPWQWSDFANAVMIFSHTDLWYVPAYLGLYLLSPILNNAIQHLNRHQYAWSLLGFIFFNIYLGWWWGASFNPTGYTLTQLIMMYLIGQYLGKYGLFKNSRYLYLSIYIVASIAIIIQSLYCKSLWTFAYNSPFVVISSVAFFMIFTTIKFNSRIINTLATSAFAVYLFHKNPYIWGNIIKPLSNYVWTESSLWQFTVFVIAFIIVIYSFTFIIDRIRIFILSKLWRK